MPVRYWFPPGTDSQIHIVGGDRFKPFKTRELMRFEQPAAETPGDFTFAGDGFHVRVTKSLVHRFEWDGTGGHNRLCG